MKKVLANTRVQGSFKVKTGIIKKNTRGKRKLAQRTMIVFLRDTASKISPLLHQNVGAFRTFFAFSKTSIKYFLQFLIYITV